MTVATSRGRFRALLSTPQVGRLRHERPEASAASRAPTRTSWRSSPAVQLCPLGGVGARAEAVGRARKAAAILSLPPAVAGGADRPEGGFREGRLPEAELPRAAGKGPQGGLPSSWSPGAGRQAPGRPAQLRTQPGAAAHVTPRCVASGQFLPTLGLALPVPGWCTSHLQGCVACEGLAGSEQRPGERACRRVRTWREFFQCSVYETAGKGLAWRH